MIEVKKVNIDNNIVSFEYKTDLDDTYKNITYNLETDEIIKSDDKISDIRLNYIFHAIKEIKRRIKEKNIKTDLTVLWY